MPATKTALATTLALAALLSTAQAQAATAVARVAFDGTTRDTGAGRAFAERSNQHARGLAAGYEFAGGVGVSAGATAGSTFAEAFATASFTDGFTVSLDGGDDLFPIADGFYTLWIPINATGTVAAANAPVPGNPGAHSYGGARYTYSYAISGMQAGQGATVSGGESVFDIRDFSGNVSKQRAGQNPVVAIDVIIGDFISLSLSASAEAQAIAAGTAGAGAAADFSHTLRWGGVSAITATDGNGNPIALPDDFRLSLMGSNGFDYWNAAGRNPFTSTAVPEPATWAMMTLGFAGTGLVVRRRRTPLAA